MRLAVLQLSSVAVTTLALAAVASSDDAAATKSVTLLLERAYDDSCFCYYLRFRGRISPRRANEYVAVQQRKCGLDFATSVAGASTRADGSWVAKSTVPASTSATYRARWSGRLSKRVSVRPPIGVRLTKLAPQRYRVDVSIGDARQNMAARFVELQRLRGGVWTRVRRAPLEADDSLIGSYFATFAVRTRGLRLRVAVPRESAAPCFTPAVTQIFVS
jgi:hypothetical protein